MFALQVLLIQEGGAEVGLFSRDLSQELTRWKRRAKDRSLAIDSTRVEVTTCPHFYGHKGVAFVYCWDPSIDWFDSERHSTIYESKVLPTEGMAEAHLTMEVANAARYHPDTQFFRAASDVKIERLDGREVRLKSHYYEVFERDRWVRVEQVDYKCTICGKEYPDTCLFDSPPGVTSRCGDCGSEVEGPKDPYAARWWPRPGTI